MQSKSAVEVLMQLNVILDFCIVFLISILISELRDCQKTKLLLNLSALNHYLVIKNQLNIQENYRLA